MFDYYWDLLYYKVQSKNNYQASVCSSSIHLGSLSDDITSYTFEAPIAASKAFRDLEDRI